MTYWKIIYTILELTYHDILENYLYHFGTNIFSSHLYDSSSNEFYL